MENKNTNSPLQPSAPWGWSWRSSRTSPSRPSGTSWDPSGQTRRCYQSKANSSGLAGACIKKFEIMHWVVQNGDRNILSWPTTKPKFQVFFQCEWPAGRSSPPLLSILCNFHSPNVWCWACVTFQTLNRQQFYPGWDQPCIKLLTKCLGPLRGFAGLSWFALHGQGETGLRFVLRSQCLFVIPPVLVPFPVEVERDQDHSEGDQVLHVMPACVMETDSCTRKISLNCMSDIKCWYNTN